MGAPAVTARLAPVGRKMDDGFPMTIAFALDPDVSFWEKEVTPSGMDWGEPNDNTTMFNNKRRTYSPKKLWTRTPLQLTVTYDPNVRPQIDALGGKNGAITTHYSNTDTDSDYGFLKSFKPKALSQDEKVGEADIEIVFTGEDANGVEQDPVFVNNAGTGTGP